MAKFKALRPVLKPVLSNALKGGKSSLSRFFTRFDAPAKSYIQLSSPITLSGDFRVSGDFVIPANGGALIGSSVNSSAIRIEPSSSNRVRVVIDVDFNDFNNALDGLDTTVLHTLEVVKTGTELELFIDNVSKGTQFTSNTATFDLIGQDGGNVRHFEGYVANVKIEDAGNLVLDMPIDGNYSPISNVVIDKSSSGNNGTFVNVSAGDSQFYTFNRELNGYLGPQLFPSNPNWQGDPVTESGGVYTGTGNSFLDIAVEDGSVYRIGTDLVRPNAGGTTTAYNEYFENVNTLQTITSTDSIFRLFLSTGGQIARPTVQEFLGLS